MKEFKPEVKHGIVHRHTESLFRYNGWPTICKDKRGVLYAAASGFRLQHVDPAGKSILRISRDEGETWSLPMILNDTFLDDRDTGILAYGDGKMIMSWFTLADSCERHATYEWLPDPEKAMILGMGSVLKHLTPEQTQMGSYVKMSNDYGFTWSERVRIPLTCPHGPSIMSDGSLIMLGKSLDDPEDINVPGRPIVAYKSTDDGKTWTHVGTVPKPDDLILDMMHEPHVIELPNGRLLGAIRVHCRPVQPDFTVYTTFSDDGGHTWSMPQCIGVDGSPPHLMLHSSGAVICSYARRRGDGDRSERAVISYDGGETWSEDYMLNDNVPFNDLGYPSSVELSDGSIFTIYYQCYPGDNFCSILSTKWRLNGK